MVRLEAVTYYQDKNRFKFDFKTTKGHCTAILGKSGAGKSTFLNLIAGYITPHSGKIYIDNHEVAMTPVENRPLSMLFQENNLFEHLSVYRNLAFGVSTHLWLNADDRNEVIKMAHNLGLSAHLKKKPWQLSGGQRQRLALGRCLLRKQPVLLLDEPFSALDRLIKTEIMNLLKQIQADKKLTILFVTHDIEEANRLADDCIYIENGQII